MSCFPIPWLGNKRSEVPIILPHINPQCDTFVECFCGSAALSMAVKASRPENEPHFICGDHDLDLIEFCRGLRDDGLDAFNDWVRPRLTVEKFNIIDKKEADGPYEWYYKQRVTRGRFDKRNIPPKKWPSLNVTSKHRTGEAFYRDSDLDLICDDWHKIIEPHLDNPNASIYLDPPYFGSFNQVYYGMKRGLDNECRCIDSTQTLVDILRLFETAQAQIILSINGCAIIVELFKQYTVEMYEHTYSLTVKAKDGNYKGKKTVHLLVANR